MEELLHVPLVVRPPGGGDGAVVDRPASLTEFPRFVEAVVGGADVSADDGDATFVPDGPVVAATDGIDPDTQERARAHRADLRPLTTAADAAYEDEESGVRKSVVWGDREAEIVVHDAHARWTVGDSAPIVHEVIAGLADAGVRDAAADVDADVKQRLEDLGYA